MATTRDFLYDERKASSLEQENNKAVLREALTGIVVSVSVAIGLYPATYEHAAVLEDVPEMALNQSLEDCMYMALPWAQCGGSSSCPEAFNKSCSDDAWPSVCCPPANDYQQVKSILTIAVAVSMQEIS